MVRNFEIDGPDQHALSYIESSEVFLSFARIIFSQKCLIVKLEEKMKRLLNFFTTLIQNKCLPYAPTNTFCGLSTIR